MDISYYKKYEPIFGEWSIVREIGEGSFGKVFEIERRDFGYTYKAALKAITIPQSRSEIERIADDGMGPESVTAYFRGFVQELVEEFRIMSKLKGESNIVSYEDHRVIEHTDEIGWDVFIRMELLTPLTKYAKEHGISRADVIRLGIDICSALELCRKNNIIHRDIKPENIFVSENGKFKLGDFGIAKTVEKTTGGLSKKGTYTYMAPEVYKGEAYGASVDIYSLGIVLYRFMNNNRAPFLPPYPPPIKYADRESAMARRIKGETLPAPANADEALSQVILKACAYKPEERYRSAADMRRDLEALLGDVEQQPDLDKTVGVFSGKGTAKVDAPVTAATDVKEPEPASETAEPVSKTAAFFAEPLPTVSDTGTVGIFSGSKAAPLESTVNEPVQLPTVSDAPKFKTESYSPSPEKEVRSYTEDKPQSSTSDSDKAAKKKRLKLLLAACFVLAIGIFIAILSNQPEASGICGANLEWTFSGGTLTISGEGAMDDYDYDHPTAPWSELAIKEIVVEDGVTSIGDYAFYECVSLTSVAIPDSVTSIGKYAFSECISLTSLAIPDSVTSIGEWAFHYCTSLTSLAIPDSVTSIGDYAFSYCNSLESVTIPDSVTSIGEGAFYYCDSLTSVAIPDSVTSIGKGAFYYCDSLTSVAILDSVTSIGNHAFRSCTSLTSVAIPDSVTSIGNGAFYDCDSLTDVYYSGSEAQWASISIDNGNEPLRSATKHYNS